MSNKDGEGALFKNDKKETQQHPDYKGSITIGGQEYWLSAWLRTAKTDGKKYMGLSAQPKQPRQPAREPVAESEDFDDALPF